MISDAFGRPPTFPMLRRAFGRGLALAALLLFTSVALAQIGQAPETVTDTLGVEAADDGAFAVSDTFTVQVEVRGGLLYAVSANGTFDEAGRQEAASLIGEASGFGEGIVGPVLDFFDANLVNLAGLGPQRVGVEQYALELDIDDGDAPYTGSIRFALQEIREQDFPPAAASIGPEDATYVIREFSDFQCPYCAQFANNTLPNLKDVLLMRGNVRFEYHHFPLQSIHANAVPAAEAAECVKDVAGVDAFWAFHDTLFERQQAWSGLGEPQPYFVRTANELGFDGDAVGACIDEGRFNADVLDAYDTAVALRLTGTPTVFVNGFKVQQNRDLVAYERMFELVDAFDVDSATP